MGQTPSREIQIRTTRSTRNPEGLDWWVARIDITDPTRPVREAIGGPFGDYPQAIVAWRIAGHYVRPVLTSVEGWTFAHQDGWCGGDNAGCLHCRSIAEHHESWGDADRLILANRRNFPFGYGQAVLPDRDAPERAKALTAPTEA